MTKDIRNFADRRRVKARNFEIDGPPRLVDAPESDVGMAVA
jgi:hypothetical protein